MTRDYMGRAAWEDEMKAATHAPTWEIFDGSDGTTCPPGLLLSLGDGRAVEVTAEMLAAARQGDVWRHASRAVREDTIEMAQKWIDRLIQQAQEADRASTHQSRIMTAADDGASE